MSSSKNSPNIWLGTNHSTLSTSHSNTISYNTNASSNISTPISYMEDTIKINGNISIEKGFITMEDEKDGTKWAVKIYDGELIIEPLCKKGKRKYNIKRILK